MSQQSMSLLEFQERFCNEEACLDYLFSLRWPNGFVCPRCGHKYFSFVSSRRLYQCSACRRQASITSGTIFHKTRTPIRKWFWMIFMIIRQKSGVSILRMQKLLSIGSYRTAWLMGHKIRSAMVDRDSKYKLAGLVEMDGAAIDSGEAGPKGRKGKGKRKLLIGIELRGENGGFCFMSHLRRTNDESNGVVRNDGADSNISTHSSSSAAYGEHGLEADRKGIIKLRWVYAAIANIKGNIRGVHHGVSAKHLQRYLSEFCYRLNRRGEDAQLFDKSLEACLAAKTVTWAELTI